MSDAECVLEYIKLLLDAGINVPLSVQAAAERLMRKVENYD